MLITSPQALAPYFDWRVTPVNLTSGGVTKLAPGDSNRVAIAFSLGQAAAEVYVSPKADISIGRGFYLTVNNTPLEFFFRDYGSMVSAEWFGFTTFMGGVLMVIETVYKPPQIEGRKQWTSIALSRTLKAGQL